MKSLEQLHEICERMRKVVQLREENAKEILEKAAMCESGKDADGNTYRTHVLVCGGTGCTSSGSARIRERLEKEIEANGLSDEVCVVKTGCFGLCALGPIMIVYPEGTFYSMVQEEDIPEIVTEHLLKGNVVKHLLYEETVKADKIIPLNETNFYKKQHRVALRNCGVINPEKIDEYIGTGGYEALGIVLTEKKPEDVIQILGTYDITTIRASMGMYLVCKAIHEQTDIRVLLTGEISDELFGYKYTDFAPDPKAFQEESVKRIRELHMYDVLRADRCISVNSLEARVPFGDLDFVTYVMAVNPELKMNHYGKGKYLLRHAFQEDECLPEEILWREKAAFSDAVGHSMVDYLKEYAESVYTDQELETRAEKYTYAKPFTKESLLYREIFEKYYPGQAEMIAGFWMPNKEWEGCNVNDPSARVLSNYGESGK